MVEPIWRSAKTKVNILWSEEFPFPSLRRLELNKVELAFDSAVLENLFELLFKGT